MNLKKLLVVYLLSIYPLSSNAMRYNYFDIDNKTSNIFYSKVSHEDSGLENGRDGENGGDGGNGGNGG